MMESLTTLRTLLCSLLIIIMISLGITKQVCNDTVSVLKLKILLLNINSNLEEVNDRQMQSNWNYMLNPTPDNAREMHEANSAVTTFHALTNQQLQGIPLECLEDPEMIRQIEKLTYLCADVVTQQEQVMYQKMITQMISIYYERINGNGNDNSSISDAAEIMAKNPDPKELTKAWIDLRESFDYRMRSNYTSYVQNRNQMARHNNFSNYAEYWIREYETEDFKEQIEQLWSNLKPLYLQLHAYVRRELRKKYGDEVSRNGPIPAHLLGDLRGITWINLANFTLPFPQRESPDVTNSMVEQGYNTTSIFGLAEDFFVSLNLSSLPISFWEKSVLENKAKPTAKCHASAWGFYRNKDVRIHQCTHVDMENLLTTHHEMGHVQYYLSYAHQPSIFKSAANPGFHEAVGDTIALSVSTANHLKSIGLLKTNQIHQEHLINHLYVTALEKIVIMPFIYVMDLWRWEVFEGKIQEQNYNCQWWNLTENLQGIEPPVNRSESNFDPGAALPITADMNYIKYFVSNIIQFQFHKALCTVAGRYDPNNPDSNPLNNCDIYNNKKAGLVLRSMMKLGASKPWPDAMEVITGQRQMNSDALLEYFRPLMEWLTEENQRTNEYIGWEPSEKKCTPT